MGRKKDSIKGYTSTCYIKVNGVDVPWYEVEFLDDDGKEKKVTWFLPREKTEEYVAKMLENIGKRMSDYVYANPDSTYAKSIGNEPGVYPQKLMDLLRQN
ncbi:MAG: hypothetical protein UE295_01200 [Acutalibacteraceae bacterium]|nr:hypothetical protein [Acutalibacteraceae bacterium]